MANASRKGRPTQASPLPAAWPFKSGLTLLALSSIFYFTVYGWRLAFPPDMYFDEVYYVKTARELVYGIGQYTETAHPPLAKCLMGLHLLVLGDKSWVWRLPALWMGFGSLMLLYGIARQLSGNPRLAFFTALLFALDGLSFTMARIGMLSAPKLFFSLLALYAITRHAVAADWPRRPSFALCGIAFGMAMACRWDAFPIAVMIAWCVYLTWTRASDRQEVWRDVFLFLMLLPTLVYFSTFLVFVPMPRYGWTWIYKFQKLMTDYHFHLKVGHVYGSPWWSWPFLVRPLWLFFRNQEGVVNGILCIGNPAIYWMFPLVWASLLGRFFKEKRKPELSFAILGFFSQWLPWAFVGRVKFFHYFYSAIPFAMLATALCLDRIWESGQAGRRAVILYLAAVIGLAAYWYPLWSGWAIPRSLYQNYMWFRSWI